MIVALAPLVGVLALRAPLVNALPYRDPWFYSGYGWTLAHHVEVFGWFYYAVRFPVTLPIAWSSAVLGPVGGYLVLRYLIFVATAGLVYACVRRFSSAWVAAAGAVLLCLDPFYVRLVLWDYTSFVALPCTIAAAAVWFLGDSGRRGLPSAVLSGALLSAAVFANPLSGIAIPALFGVEAIAAARGGWTAVLGFALRLVGAVVGAALLFVLGYLGYAAFLGHFPPKDLVQPTLDFLRANKQLAAPFQIPARTWLANEPRVYAPVLAGLAVVVVLRRELVANTLAARVAQFAVAYTAVIWLYRKFVVSSVIETWWAYSMTAVTICFAMPVILDSLAVRGAGRPRKLVVAASVAGAVITDVIVRSFEPTALSLYADIKHETVALVALIVVAVVASVALWVCRGPLVAAAMLVFAVVLTVVALAPATYIGIGQTGEFTPSGRAELQAYDGAYRMAELLKDHDQPDARTLLWSSMSGFASGVTWENLPHQQGGIQDAEKPVQLPHLTPAELDLLRYPTTRGILVLTENQAEFAAASRRLARLGFAPAAASRGLWADGHLRYALFEKR